MARIPARVSGASKWRAPRRQLRPSGQARSSRARSSRAPSPVSGRVQQHCSASASTSTGCPREALRDGDEQLGDSWCTFMAERRARQEKASCRRSTSSDGSSGTSVASSADSRAQTNGVPHTSASVPGCSRSRRQGVLRARWPVHSESAAGRSIRPRGDSKVRGARSESGAVRVRHVSVSVMRLRGRLSSHACKSRYGFLGGRPRD